ncbi:GIY-YIG catalytic domain-containing endonuclease [Paramecium bursaria Chlorella virus OR0704.2.2]|nr:GIY-YIG catalytic domain-containing endonuclease [Paramecium bursaria Chlorella virus OR0704.2.2]
MVKKHLIYLLECKGKFYVGRTCNFETRMRVHERMTDDCRLLNRAIEKYGWKNFDISVLEDDLTFEEAVVREPYFISLLETVKYGYNILLGGEGFGSGKDCVNFGRKHTKDHRRKNSEAKKGEKNPNWNKPRGAAVSKKISDSQPKKTPVFCTYTLFDMSIVFETIADASRFTGVSTGRISSIVNEYPEINKHGNVIVRRQANGFLFTKKYII